MTDEIGAVLTQVKGRDGERSDLVAIGGTLFGNALSMAAARATMLEILTPEAYASTQRLGARLAEGMASAVARVGLPCTSTTWGRGRAIRSGRSQSTTPTKHEPARTTCSPG